MATASIDLSARIASGSVAVVTPGYCDDARLRFSGIGSQIAFSSTRGSEAMLRRTFFPQLPTPSIARESLPFAIGAPFYNAARRRTNASVCGGVGVADGGVVLRRDHHEVEGGEFDRDEARG